MTNEIHMINILFVRAGSSCLVFLLNILNLTHLKVNTKLACLQDIGNFICLEYADFGKISTLISRFTCTVLKMCDRIQSNSAEYLHLCFLQTFLSSACRVLIFLEVAYHSRWDSDLGCMIREQTTFPVS